MKLVKEDVWFTGFMWAMYLLIFWVSQQEIFQTGVKDLNVAIILVGIVAAISSWACLWGIRRYKEEKVTVNTPDSFFKFVLYKNLALLVNQDNQALIYHRQYWNIDLLAKVEHISITLYYGRTGKDRGYNIAPYKYVNEIKEKTKE